MFSRKQPVIFEVIAEVLRSSLELVSSFSELNVKCNMAAGYRLRTLDLRQSREPTVVRADMKNFDSC